MTIKASSRIASIETVDGWQGLGVGANSVEVGQHKDKDLEIFMHAVRIGSRKSPLEVMIPQEDAVNLTYNVGPRLKEMRLECRKDSEAQSVLPQGNSQFAAIRIESPDETIVTAVKERYERDAFSEPLTPVYDSAKKQFIFYVPATGVFFMQPNESEGNLTFILQGTSEDTGGPVEISWNQNPELTTEI